MLRYPQQMAHQPPISRTLQYKKITKPLLERKRRARINRCLEQLKDLMVGALEAEGENINKLEKADILELTVRHLHRITKPHDPTEEVQRFQAGFTQCASEACGFLLSLPGLDTRVGKRLVEHLGRRISQSLESNPSLLSGNNVDIPQLPRGYVPSSAQDMPQLPSADGMKKESDRTSSLVPLYPHFDSETYRGETSGLQLLRQASPPEEITSQSMYKSASRSSSTQFPKLMCPQPTRTMPVGFSMSPEISLTITPRSTPMASSLSVASISSIGEDNESHGDSESMAMSPGGMSDGGSSCQSEDMWRPW